jgi:hypothetical protein
MTIQPQARLDTDWQVPSRTQALSFWLRSRLLGVARSLRHLAGHRAPRWSASDVLTDATIVAQWRTPLWNDGDERDFILTAGKVHNLRVAARAFDGVVVPAGECLSFWRQLGRPSMRRGFVRGREIREGCLIPTIAGGICQLSNSLATCAAHAGFELVERHAHTATREDTSAGIDATVFWNYVDLRIRAPVAWRLEVELGATELRVVVRVENARDTRSEPAAQPATKRPPFAALRSCLGCDETACFRHRAQARPPQAREAWLLDDCSAEFAHHLHARETDADVIVAVPARAFRAALSSKRAVRDGSDFAHVRRTVTRTWWASARRIAWQRLHARHAGRRQASIVDGQRWLAEDYARRLRPEHTHLIVDQGLLPHLQRLGVLGGRSCEVLASALPMPEIERRLDTACTHAAHTEAARATLSDFRAPVSLAQFETQAMARVQSVTTTHTDIARYWRARGGIEVRLLPWNLPARSATDEWQTSEPVLVFPASALARKGAYVLAQALRGIACRVCVLGSPSDDANLWSGIEVEYRGYASDWLRRATVLVLPAYVEHSPRAMLAAIAAGIPVIATPACGVDGLPGVTLVPEGDVVALRDAVLRAGFASATRPVDSGVPFP